CRESMAVIETRKRRFETGSVSVLRQVVLGVRRAGIGRIIQRFRQGVVGIKGQTRSEAARDLERESIERGPAVPTYRSERSELWIGTPSLNATGSWQRHVDIRRTVGMNRARAHVLGRNGHVWRNGSLDGKVPYFVVFDLIVVVDAIGPNRAGR